MNKKHILVFAFRIFDLRQLINTGIIAELVQRSDVTLIVPPALRDELSVVLGTRVRVLPAGYKAEVLSEDARSSGGRVFDHLREFLYRVLEMTYAIGPEGQINASGTIQRRSFWERMRKSPRAIIRLQGRLALVLSSWAARWRPLRRLMQCSVAWCIRRDRRGTLLQSWDCDLLVVASPGLGADGRAICEARRHGVPAVAVMQSWDKTSAKGYPPVAPDSMIVWSHIMRREAVTFMDMRPDSVYVEGAPVWDHYFSEHAGGERRVLEEQYGLRPGKKVIYVSLGLPAFHDGNMEVIRELVCAHQAGEFEGDVDLLFRLHPNYLNFQKQYAELIEFWRQYDDLPGVVFSVPHSSGSHDAYYIPKDDDLSLAAILRWCDVAVTIASSQIIEAAIFDKPVVDISFGRYRNKFHDVPMHELSFEHLMRLYAMGAAYRSFSASEMKENIRRALREPHELQGQRRELIDQELPVNRGAAAKAVALRILALAEKPPRLFRELKGEA